MDSLKALVVKATPEGTEVAVAGHDLTGQVQAVNIDMGPDGIAYATVHTTGKLPDVDVLASIRISDSEAVLHWLASVDIGKVRELVPRDGGLAGVDPVVATIAALGELAAAGME